MALKIEEYGLIGDTQTAALVGRNGSIDWACFPRFDSDACFACLLGEPKNGYWWIRPQGEVTSTRRRYRAGTLVLETELEAPAGAIRLIDFMPPRETKPDIVRIVEGVRGRVEVRMDLVIRFGYGKVLPWVERLDGGLRAVAGPDGLVLRTPVATHGEDMTTVATFKVKKGDRVPFVLTWFPSNEDPPKAVKPERALKDTVRYWHRWAKQCSYDGPWREAVVTSLLVLKALTYGPTGGIVAAATTSLPEALGSLRNWDYRFCWVRDATFTLLSLINSGYHQEAGEWRDWLLRSIAGDAADLQIMYGVAGERRLAEWEAKWLNGYEHSTPVRIGNGAAEQFQLDVYGELMDAMLQARRVGIHPLRHAWDMQLQLVDFVEHHWRDPDDGIWEMRGPRRHFTHSRVMAWVALDRAVRTVEQFKLPGPVQRWKAVRDEIHQEVCRQGYDPTRKTFTQYYGSHELDASLLMIPLVGFLPADDERVRGTIEAIQRELMHDGFVQRYTQNPEVDGLPPGEGAFLACTFWLAEDLAMLGRRDEAVDLFERLLKRANDLGLLSEEYDPRAGRLVGNFPQAFSHVALVNAALALGTGGPLPCRRHDVAARHGMGSAKGRRRRGRRGPSRKPPSRRGS